MCHGEEKTSGGRRVVPEAYARRLVQSPLCVICPMLTLAVNDLAPAGRALRNNGNGDPTKISGFSAPFDKKIGSWRGSLIEHIEHIMVRYGCSLALLNVLDAHKPPRRILGEPQFGKCGSWPR